MTKSTSSYFILLLILLLAKGKSVSAQFVSSYTFSQSTSNAYTPITGGSVLASGTGYDNERYVISLPFIFNFDNVGYNTANIAINGFISFGSIDPGPGYWMIQSANSGFRLISGFDANLASLNATTQLSYKTLGTIPNRIFVAQWTNFGYPLSTALSTNFQIKLYETSNKIEISYGNCSLAIPSSLSVQVGLRGLSNLYYNNRYSSFSSWTGTSTGTTNSDAINYSAGNDPSNTLTYTYTPPVFCTAPNQASNLVLTPALSSISGSFAAPVPAADKYIVVRTPTNSALNTNPVNGTTYASGSALGNGIVVYNGSLTSFTSSGLNGTTMYTYTVFSYNQSGCAGGPVYNTVLPITDSIETLGPKKYVWLPVSGSADFQLATNWSPVRIAAINADTLSFSNGGSSMATNVPTQVFNLMEVTGNTAIALQSVSTCTLTLNDSLYIGSGSTLTLGVGSGAVALKYILGFNNSTIDGTLIVESSSEYNTMNHSTKVNGTVTVSGPGAAVTVNTYNNMNFMNGSNYYHARNGGTIPDTYFSPGSNTYITGCTNTAPSFTNYEKFGNFIWDCPGQIASVTIPTPIDTIYNYFKFLNSNSYSVTFGYGPIKAIGGDFIQNNGTIVLGNNSGTTTVLGNVFLNGGTLDMNSGGYNSNFSYTLNVREHLTQQPAHTFTKSGTMTGKLVFNGSTHQNISMGGTSANVPINYILSNQTGATLTGILTVGNGAVNQIQAGKWDGSGKFSYDPLNSTLDYSNNFPVSPSNVDWPNINPPVNLNVNSSATPPNNLVKLPGNRTIYGIVTITSGVLVLDAYSLTLEGGTAADLNLPAPNNSRMIAADGTGSLIRKINPYAGTSNVLYTFPVGDIQLPYHASGFNLRVTANTTNRYIGVRVSDIKHPNEISNTDYVTRYWSLTDNLPSTPFSYYSEFKYPSSDNVGSPNFCLQKFANVAWTQIPSLFVTTTDTSSMTMPNVVSSTAYPVTGDYTGRTCVNDIYTWTAAVDVNYQNAANWNPIRTYPKPSDILQFNSGNNDTVKNIPSDKLARLLVTNNTTVSFQAAILTTAHSYHIYSDNDTSTNELFIENGSSLLISGSVYAFGLEFGAAGSIANAKIDGRLELVTTQVNKNTINFANCKTIVSPSGTFAIGPSVVNPNPVSNSSTIEMNGTYEHKFTTTGGYIPPFNWKPGSTLLIDGYTSLTGGIDYVDTIYNMVYNCPNQITDVSSATLPTVLGTLNIISTGTGKWKWFNSTFSPYTFNVNNINHSGGIVNIAAATSTALQLVNLSGNYIQSGGQIMSTGLSSPTLNCNGNAGIQTLQFFNYAPTGPIIYQITNPNGIQLNGVGTLANSFDINSGGGVIISGPNSNAINTSLQLNYNANTTLAFTGQYNYTLNQTLFPNSNSPKTFKVDIGSNNTITIPFDCTIPDSLQMKSGYIMVGSQLLTLGISATNTGKLTWTSGSLILTTGAFTRWFGTNGLPTSAGTDKGFFPISSPDYLKRNVSVYFNSSGALNNGGTLSLTHNNLIGNINGLNVTDGAATLVSRSNASWQFTAGNGLAMSAGTCGLRITAGGLCSPVSGPLHVMQTNSVSGVHVVASGTSPDFMIERLAMNLTDLTSLPHYIGSENNLSSNVFISVSNGNWSNGSTWNQGIAPGAGSIVIISTGTQVEVDGNALAKTINVHTGGILSNTLGSLLIDSIFINSGAVQVNGGSIVIGPMGGGKIPFINYGTLNVSSGTLFVNGNLSIENGSTFIQSGGNISLDGNANSVIANSVPDATAILYFNTPLMYLTGGSITIIDPHSETSNRMTIQVGTNTGIVSCSPNHILNIGDGILTISPVSFSALEVDFGSLANHVNAGQVFLKMATSSNGTVRLHNNLNILGNLTLENNSALTSLGATIAIKGNLTVNSGTYITSDGTIAFTDRTAAIEVPVTVPQIFTTPGASFGVNSLYINNTSASGVQMFTNISLNGVLTFVHGILNTGNHIITKASTAQVNNASQATGWIYGKYRQQVFNSNPLNHSFPVGDSLAYFPLTLTGPAYSAIQTAGYITVGSFNLDHPAIFSSPVLSNKSVNKYLKIELDSAIVVGSQYVTAKFQWNSPSTDPSVNPFAFITTHYAAGNWDTSGTSFPGASDMLYSYIGTSIAGDYQIGEKNTTPMIAQQPVSQTVCEGTSISFTAVASSPASYQWQVYNGTIWTNVIVSSVYSNVTSSTLSLTNVPLSLNSSLYRCLVQFGNNSAYSIPVQLTINPILIPGATITSSPSNIICAGTTVTFSASATNGGTDPQYQWKINGNNTGSNNDSLLVSTLATNDIVTCEVTNNAVCPSTTLSLSNVLTMTVNPILTPSVTIAANPGPTACAGSSVTFTATPVNGGSTPIYQWKKNAVVVGTNSPTYTDNTLVTGNSIVCKITSNETCISTAIATSNTISMTMTALATPIVTISANPGITICSGTNVTFTAATIGGGATPQYQWLKNGLPVGTNSTTYSDNGLLNSDQISCVLTSSLQCVSVANDTSNVLTMIVNPSLTPSAIISVNPSDTICLGSVASFSAVITNPGTSVSYSWRKNGTPVSSALIYSTSSLTNGDIINLVINTSPQCATTTIDTSNDITMTVLSNVFPVVDIVANPGNIICTGNSVTFTASPTFGGTTPIYQWKKNNVNVGTNAATYTDNSLVNGDNIQCEMQGNQSCATVSTVVSNIISITVNPIVTANVSITVLPSTSICNGSSATFTATPINGGSSPDYQWQINGVNSGLNSNVFNSSALSNGDIVHCILNTSNTCATPSAVTSNDLTMTVNPSSISSVTISANPGTVITTGQLVTFTATPVNVGSTPSYQWKLNGSNVGTNSNTYTSTSLVNADEITCVVTSSDPCSSPAIAISNLLKISIADAVVELSNTFSDIYYYPNPSHGIVTLKGHVKDNKEADLKYEIVSVTGQSVQSGDIEVQHAAFEKQIQFDTIESSGLYILKLSFGIETAYYRIVLSK